MAKNITLMGANYPDVPAVVLPKTGGGSAMFVDADEIESVENALAITIDGDYAPKAITKGQYLFIKNHSTLAAGGYHAKSNISSGATISSSNVESDADGISNAIGNIIAEMFPNIVGGSIPAFGFYAVDESNYGYGEDTGYKDAILTYNAIGTKAAYKGCAILSIKFSNGNGCAIIFGNGSGYCCGVFGSSNGIYSFTYQNSTWQIAETSMIGKTKLGTAVDLLNYTSSQMYTFPSDGYVRLDSGTVNATGVNVYILGDTGTDSIFISARNSNSVKSYECVFVRAGMRAYSQRNGSPQDHSAQFIPLV